MKQRKEILVNVPRSCDCLDQTSKALLLNGEKLHEKKEASHNKQLAL